MEKEMYIWGIIIVAVLVIIYMLYKYKKEALEAVAYYVVIQAEEYFGNGGGKEKLKFAITRLKEKIPGYLAWLISEKIIIEMIEKSLANLQTIFKGTKEKQIEIINTVINNIKLEPLDKFKLNNLKSNIENGIEGYIEGRTNFSGDNSLAAGIKFKI